MKTTLFLVALALLVGYLGGSITESRPRREPPPHATTCDLTLNCLECHHDPR